MTAQGTMCRNAERLTNCTTWHPAPPTRGQGGVWLQISRNVQAGPSPKPGQGSVAITGRTAGILPAVWGGILPPVGTLRAQANGSRHTLLRAGCPQDSRRDGGGTPNRRSPPRAMRPGSSSQMWPHPPRASQIGRRKDARELRPRVRNHSRKYNSPMSISDG